MSTVVGSGAQRFPGQCGTPRKRALPHPLACNHAAQDIRYRRDERSLVLRWKERQPRRTPGVIAVSNSGWNRLAAAFRDWNTQVYDLSHLTYGLCFELTLKHYAGSVGTGCGL